MQTDKDSSGRGGILMLHLDGKIKVKLEKLIIFLLFVSSVIMILLTLSGCGNESRVKNPVMPAIEAISEAKEKEVKMKSEQKGENKMNFEIKKTNDEWKKELSPEEYHVMREKGTERPFTGKYYSYKGHGVYKCAACGNVLFKSDAKFDSGTGWPSFDKSVDDKSIKLLKDNSYGMTRIEVVCGKCGAHLGHVFEDGPTETGKRFCINSCSLKMDEKKDEKKIEDKK